MAPVGSVTPTLDPEMRESVSILESDINKTIENNDKKLKEEQAMVERIMQQKGHTIAMRPAVVATSSERSSYDLAVDFVTPIVETIAEDERIEVIQTNAPFAFDFEGAAEKQEKGRSTVVAADGQVIGKVRRVLNKFD